MRLRFLALSAALLMAIVAGQSFLLQTTHARNAPDGAVISHTVFAGACAGSDLHVMRYLPADSHSATPLSASWCA